MDRCEKICLFKNWIHLQLESQVRCKHDQFGGFDFWRPNALINFDSLVREFDLKTTPLTEKQPAPQVIVKKRLGRRTLRTTA